MGLHGAFAWTIASYTRERVLGSPATETLKFSIRTEGHFPELPGMRRHALLILNVGPAIKLHVIGNESECHWEYDGEGVALRVEAEAKREFELEVTYLIMPALDGLAGNVRRC